jgi:hypothetical protein
MQISADVAVLSRFVRVLHILKKREFVREGH